MAKKMIICKNCGHSVPASEVKRIFGKDSKPYTKGFCSAQCYTEHITDYVTEDIRNRGTQRSPFGIGS